MTKFGLRARLGGVQRRQRWAAAAGTAAMGMLIAAAGFGPAAASTTGMVSGRPPASTADCNSVTTCYTPHQLRVAYAIQPLLDRGISGRGQTVVLPALAEQQLSPPLVSNIRQDLAGFDQLFHLPAARLQVTTTFAPGAQRWLSYGEETLDVEMIHAVAPAATIRLVLFNASALASAGGLITALTDTVRLGTYQGDVISISAAGGEHCFTSAEVARLHAALRGTGRSLGCGVVVTPPPPRHGCRRRRRHWSGRGTVHRDAAGLYAGQGG
jgi:hypothetical protein